MKVHRLRSPPMPPDPSESFAVGVDALHPLGRADNVVAPPSMQGAAESTRSVAVRTVVSASLVGLGASLVLVAAWRVDVRLFLAVLGAILLTIGLLLGMD